MCSRTILTISATLGLDAHMPTGTALDGVGLTEGNPTEDGGSSLTTDRAPCPRLILSNTRIPEGGKGQAHSSSVPRFHIGEGLPPVPGKIATRIQNWKYVEMLELLPEFWATSGEDDTTKRISRARAKKRVQDIHVWLQCYAVYVGVIATKSPECIPELMAYMICILRASQEYEGTACATYDLAFRRQAATTGNKQWSKINSSLYAVYFTVLRWEDWEECLRNHPDRRFVDYLTQGIREGFRIGYNYGAHQCKKAKDNMRSAMEHPQVVHNYIARECAEGRILGPFDPQSLLCIQTSRFGVILKGSGGWRLILDLSSSEGWSVNDGIDPELCSLSYVTVDDAAAAIVRLGRGAELAKVDIKSAYRIVSVHPEDRILLGMLWEGFFYVDSVLPFGLRSAPIIFTAIADALEWAVRQEGVKTLPLPG